MTETNNMPITGSAPETSKPATMPIMRRRNTALLVFVIVVLLAIIAALLWQSINTRQRFDALEQVLTQRLEQYTSVNQQSIALAKRAEERSSEAVAKTQLLEQKLAESRNQQESLQTLYHELAYNREERVVAEIEQLLIIANQQLQLAGNIKPALLALQTAYTRLQQIGTPQAVMLRKTIIDDIQQLQNLPQADIGEMNIELESLAQAIDTLPLVSDRHPKSTISQPVTQANPWRQLAYEVWQDFKSLVRLERIDRVEPPLLSPDQTFFLRENVKLRLLMARIALLQHDAVIYRANMKAAEQWIQQYFDVREPAVRKVLFGIQQLSQAAVDTSIPDINESLGLVSKYKLSMERSSRADRPSTSEPEQE